MNFLVIIQFSFDFLIYVTFKLNICKSFVWFICFNFLRIFKVLIFLKSLTGHPIFERSLFREHCHITIIFGPSWLFDFLLFRLLWFCFRNFFNFRFGLLFLCKNRSLVFRKIFLFRIFRLIFSFFNFGFFFD